MTHPTIAQTTQLIEHLHQHQHDWAGAAYHLHPIAVMRLLPTIDAFHHLTAVEQEIAAHTALLHDTLEDVWVERGSENLRPLPDEHPAARRLMPDDLRHLGYDDEVIAAVVMLTREPGNQGKSYRDKIRDLAASGNMVAIIVKLADNMHNSDPVRRESYTAEQREKSENMVRRRYEPSMAILRAALESQARNERVDNRRATA